MDLELIKESIWRQFGASIDMLENALEECPPELWDASSKFWYKAYHTIFYLDYYLTSYPKNFLPPPPFTLSEFDPNDKMPDRTYNKKELLAYLKLCRVKCRNLISGLTVENSKNRWVNKYKNMNILEILLYNMRHVQHHAAQLNLLLRQGIEKAPGWISQTKLDL
jgi:hypothetical protein